MSGLKSFAKTLAGTGLEIFRRDLVRDIDSGKRTSHDVKARELILRARLVRARLRGDAAAIEKAQFAYWGGNSADSYYDRFLNRFNDWFLGPHQVIVDELVKLTGQTDFTRLVEMGCGDGRVLEHCAKRLPGITQFIGIDINPVIIERNRQTYSQQSKLSFESGDAGKWLATMPQAGTILMTYGGVMEYFTADDLSGIFGNLAKQTPAAVALVEPVDPAHDLARDKKSHVFGTENSFSHNHRALLEASGYRIRFAQEMMVGKIRWMILLAASEENDAHV